MKAFAYLIKDDSIRERLTYMNIDIVFSGGGVKAYALAGAVQAVEAKQLKVIRAAGTSAGAIIAGLMASGYSAGEISSLIEELNLQQLLDPPAITKKIPFIRWPLFYYRMGLYKGRKLEKWLQNVLAAKGVSIFSNLPDGSLKMIASDLTLGRLIVLPDDLKRIYDIEPDHFSVAKAIRMSAGFPFFFEPRKMIGREDVCSLIVDGGILSNFPLWVFESEKIQKRPVLGVKLSGSDLPDLQRNRIRNVVDMSQAMISTMKNAHDTRFVSETERDNVMVIPVGKIETMDFHISTEQKKKLFDIGQDAAARFLKYWPAGYRRF